MWLCKNFDIFHDSAGLIFDASAPFQRWRWKCISTNSISLSDTTEMTTRRQRMLWRQPRCRLSSSLWCHCQLTDKQYQVSRCNVTCLSLQVNERELQWGRGGLHFGLTATLFRYWRTGWGGGELEKRCWQRRQQWVVTQPCPSWRFVEQLTRLGKPCHEDSGILCTCHQAIK